MVRTLGPRCSRRVATPTVNSSSTTMRLHVNAVGAVMGGAARHLPPFLAALHGARPSWTMCVWVTSGHEPAIVPESVSVRVVPNFGTAQRLWWESAELPRALRRYSADALLNLTNSGPLRSPVPSLLYQRNALWFDPTWAPLLKGRARVLALARRQLVYLQMRRSAVTIVPSAAMAEYLLQWRGAPGTSALRVVPHGVDGERFSSAPRAWPPPAGRPVQLLSVGHAAPHKDQVLLVRLVARLRDAGCDVRLWLTVDRQDWPDYVEEIERQRRQLEVEDRVEILGRVNDVERLYRVADIVVFPSRSESFGFPVVEAMAAGIPVVASMIRASEELLGPDGWFFRPGDVNAAATAVRQLLETPAGRLSEVTARAVVTARRLTWTANAAHVAAAIEDAVRLDS